jgi:predicted DNA-binding transcriptional regulator YafY
MRRADRLFQIIEILRRKRRGVTTAAQLAERLEVSERTIYRDVADLQASGTPIEGAAGVGYTLRPGFDLPPLMFDAGEIEALVLGARIVGAFGDAELARASRRVLDKISAVLPDELRPLLSRSLLFAPGVAPDRKHSKALQVLRVALQQRNKVRIEYTTDDLRTSARVIRPLGAFFWGRVWTVSAYCELREDFRTFRLDRIAACELLEETFVDEPGRSLRELLARHGEYAERLLEP